MPKWFSMLQSIASPHSLEDFHALVFACVCGPWRHWDGIDHEPLVHEMPSWSEARLWPFLRELKRDYMRAP
jgi:hypothetical protein